VKALLLLVASSFLLASCGGGGGGDGGGGGGGTPDAFSLSASTISFTAPQGGAAPAAQSVTITVLSGSVFVDTSQSGAGQFSHSFQITGTTTGVINITPFAPTNPGTTTGTITVRGCSNPTCDGSDVAGSPKTITVTYTVTPGPALTATPSTVAFETTAGNNPATQNVTLSLSGASANWSAAISNYTGSGTGWLSVNPLSDALSPANPSDIVTFSVDTTGLSAGAYGATVTFTAGTLTRTVPVTLNINALGVNFVAPYVAIAGATGNVIIRGNGFTGAATAVNFGGTLGTGFSLVSDTEIRVTHPVLPPGTYPVTVTGGPAATRANLVVINPPTLLADAITRQMPRGGVGNLIYDAQRQALYLIDADNARIERYRFIGASWQADSFAVGGGGGNIRIALSPDGTELLQTGGSVLARRNALTFAPLAGADASSLLGPGAATNIIGFGNDGRAVISASSPTAGATLFRYDMLNQSFSGLSTLPDMANRSIVASADGDTIVLPTFEPLAPGFFKPVVTYDATAGALTTHSITSGGTEHASVSRDGSRMILVSSPLSASQTTTVYDFIGGVLTTRGDLPAGLSAFVISPDGATAYAYFAAGGGTVRKYDLTNPGVFPQTASVAAASPGTFFNAMTISPDGGWLFLAGNERVIILPAP
jgi:hypothetical protein